MPSRFYKLDDKPKIRRREVNLRDEFNSTLLGSVYEIPKGFTVLHRQFRRNENGYRIPCACNVAKEGQAHQKCSVCLGEGYLWDETYTKTFKVDIGSDQEKAGASLLTEIGRTKKQFCKFYLFSNIDIDYEDKIIELELSPDGNVLKPERRGISWTVNSLNEKRADDGRIEYIILYCRKY